MAVLAVVGLAVVVAAASRGGRRGSAADADAAAEAGGEAEGRPMRDRPGGPAAEANMDPGPGVWHPDEQHDADGPTEPQRDGERGVRGGRHAEGGRAAGGDAPDRDR